MALQENVFCQWEANFFFLS